MGDRWLSSPSLPFLLVLVALPSVVLLTCPCPPGPQSNFLNGGDDDDEGFVFGDFGASTSSPWGAANTGDDHARTGSGALAGLRTQVAGVSLSGNSNSAGASAPPGLGPESEAIRMAEQAAQARAELAEAQRRQEAEAEAERQRQEAEAEAEAERQRQQQQAAEAEAARQRQQAEAEAKAEADRQAAEQEAQQRKAADAERQRKKQQQAAGGHHGQQRGPRGRGKPDKRGGKGRGPSAAPWQQQQQRGGPRMMGRGGFPDDAGYQSQYGTMPRQGDPTAWYPNQYMMGQQQ